MSIKSQQYWDRSDTNELPSFLQEAVDNYYHKRVRESWNGEHIFGSTKPGKHAIQLQSNDYLRLSHHPKLIQNQQNAMARFGNSNMLSSVYLGNNDLLKECEQDIASWLGMPSALISQSGWCANIAALQALSRRGLPVYIDNYAHMSLWEGIRASRAKAIPFRHNQPSSLQKRIQRFGPGIIAVDSVYSSNGSIAPLKEFYQIALENKSLLIVDESHALGIFGTDGKGLLNALDIEDYQHILITASLAKAIAGRGGVILGDSRLIDVIRNNAYPAIFSTALMPHDLIGFQTAIEIITTEPWRRKSLLDIAHSLRSRLEADGFNLYQSQSQIIALLCGSEKNTIWLRRQLESLGIFGSVFCPPATPPNKALIRLSLHCELSEKQLDKIYESLRLIQEQQPPLPLFESL